MEEREGGIALKWRRAVLKIFYEISFHKVPGTCK